MISQIKELNFPEYATLSSATVTLNDMGDRTISTQVKIDGAIVPDFSYDWEVEFKGETYIQPLRQPQASKGNESISYAIDLTFYHKTIWQLKRYYFAEMTSVESGTAIADQYISSLGLNLSDFCVAFQKVLDYYFQGRITIDLNPDVEYDNDVKFMSISYSYIWDVLQKVYEVYGVRWVIEGNTIKVGYPSVELSHTFQYGHDGGLLRVERQVQDANIRNSLLGRGGEKNLPAYYFKEAPEGSLFASDPDAIPELANIYFSNLRGKTFRDYVKGWKAKHYGGTPMDEPTEAYTKGYTDDKFSPIEYVEDKISIGKYGLLQGALDNNEEIYPSIQGAPNGEDVVVYVEPVTSDDVEQSVGKSDSVALKGMSQYRQITREQNGGYIEVELQSEIFEVSELSALSISNGVTYGVYQGFSFEQKWEGNPSVDVDEIVTNVVSNVEANKDFLPSGKYQVTTRFKITLPIYDNWPSVGSAENISFYAQLGVSTNLSLRNAIESDNDGLWKPTFDIWVKNIWGSTRNDGENDLSYAERVWRPILGDRQGNEAKVCFSSGWLSGHEDYEFTIVDFAYDNSREHNGTQSEWRLTLQKSDAELEATGKYIPSASTNGQAYAGDTFFFIGIDMPHQYVIWAEERLDNYKTSSLNEVSEIQPKWVVNFDKLRLHEGVDNLAEQIVVGGSINLADVRFIDAPSLQLYLQSVTYTWNEQTLLYPDIEVVLADTIVPVQNPVAQLQGSIDNINSQLHDIGNIAQIVRKVADSLYLRKDGVADVSKSPTKFVGDVSGHNFRRGHVGGSDWGIYHDVHGNAICEFDKIIARRDFVVNNLVVNQVSAIGGTQIMSAAAVTCSRVLEDVNGYKCFFDQKGGSIANLFAINDIAYSQIFDVNNNSIKYYKRIVKEVGIDYITLSNIDGEFDGEGIPEDGDHIIQMGNTTNVARQSVVIIDPKEGGSIKVYANIDGFNLENKNYVGIGVNSDTNEAYMFAYGDLYIGDRDIYEDGANYITFQKKDGEDKRRLFISADVKLGAGSEGLSNLSEFNSVAQVANDAKDLAESLKDQIDGRVTAHYGEGEPSKDKDPAKTWIANEEEKAHLNDTYTDTETGKSWRWLFKNNEYQWVIITDTAVTEALQKAQEALDLANAKVDVFVVQPYSPYKVKDLWLQGDSGRIMRCKRTRTSYGMFYADDWIPADQDAAALANAALSSANDYSDQVAEAAQNYAIEISNAYADGVVSEEEAARIADAEAKLAAAKKYAEQKAEEAEQNANEYTDTKAAEYWQNAQDYVDEIVGPVKNQIDGQVNSYFEAYTPSLDNYPANEWDTPELKESHVGDTFTNIQPYNDGENKDAGKSWRWEKGADNSYGWVKISDSDAVKALQDASIAQDTADGKRRTFTSTSQPTPPYDEGDLWVRSTSRILVCSTSRKDGDKYYSSDWTNADDYYEQIAEAESKIEALRTEINNTISTINGNIDEISADLGNNAAELENQKAAIKKAQDDLEDVYNKATVDGKITEAEQRAIDQAQEALEEAYDTYVAKAKEIATEQITEFIDGQYTEDIKALRGQVDGKAETWYQRNDPSGDWNTPELKEQHIGDLWYNTDTQVISRWDGGIWEETNAPKAVFDQIDGKSAIYVSIPSTYFDDDMWVLETDYSKHKDGFKEGVIVFANKNGSNDNISEEKLSQYSWGDWELKVSYTDDTVAKEAKDAAEAAQQAADDAKGVADAAKERMDGWVADDKITKIEKQAIKNELAFIEQDYASIRQQAIAYGKESIATTMAPSYVDYQRVLTEIVNNTYEVMDVPDGFADAQSAYYAARTTALQAIAELAKSLIDAVDKKVSDFDYLKKALPSGAKTTIGAGVVLSSILGVQDAGGNVVAAMIDPKSITDQTDVPYFAAGIGDVENIATTSKTMISEDGEIQLQDTGVAASSRRKVKLNTGFMKFLLGDNVSLEQTPDEYTATPSADMAFGSFTSEEKSDVTIGLPASFSPFITSASETFLVKAFDVGDSFTSITVAGGSSTINGPTVTNSSGLSYEVKFRLTNESGEYEDGGSKDVGPIGSITSIVQMRGMSISGNANIEKFKNQRVRLELVVTTASAPGGSVDLTVDFGTLYNKIVIAGNVTTSAYANRLFGNGFFFAKSETRYAGLIVDATNGPVVELKNNNQGFRFTNAGLKRWHTKLGWIPIDGVIMRGKIVTLGGRENPQSKYSSWYRDYDSSSPTRSAFSFSTAAPYTVLVSLPNSISSNTNFTADDYMVQLTGLRRTTSGTSLSYDGTSAIFASVYAQSKTTFSVYTGDDDTQNSGGFYFEVKVID